MRHYLIQIKEQITTDLDTKILTKDLEDSILTELKVLVDLVIFSILFSVVEVEDNQIDLLKVMI